MSRLLEYVDVTDLHFVAAILCIAFNPLFWNLVGRWEHQTRSLTRTFRSPYVACYCLGAVILLLNFLRSHCFTEAIKSQPKLEVLDCLPGYCAGLIIAAVGTVFVVSSFLALGFVGTFLGDYFGILMEAKVTCFPFSILDNPMYWGSTIVYLGWSIMHASPAGIILTVAVALCYTIALLYEGICLPVGQHKKKKVPAGQIWGPGPCVVQAYSGAKTGLPSLQSNSVIFQGQRGIPFTPKQMFFPSHALPRWGSGKEAKNRQTQESC
ncbi:phosphatidylethanolamine N-methyltransferase isoform X4 [Hemicordylus capensis]|nr:phosphatidylethanolamine N-methyltransferase isoform X4 [Hemicordylus capensis]XP_053131787.1 phosphatidylethanolamine N-methyltransferase isoform X4 [Hemicordylus capensis]XP_053131788.1 phosphatidylethanolamine N-methyltransferase isoform X4 [Hemicordylus capensis]